MTMRIPAADLFSEPLAMGGLPVGPFSLIYADPPWRFLLRSAKGMRKSPDGVGPDGKPRHYPTMTMAALRAMPIAEIAANDCALVMWGTFPMLPEALDLMRAWGFAYKTGGPWAKQSSTGRKWAFGTGYILRGAAEVVIVGTRGKPRWLSKSERNLWIAPVGRHSEKPDCVRESLERLIAGPKLEMFGRVPRDGWEVWGNDPALEGVAPPGDSCHDPRELRPRGETTSQHENADIAMVASHNKGG